MFGTLVISLPSIYEGGELVVRHRDEERVLMAPPARDAQAYTVQYACFYRCASLFRAAPLVRPKVKITVKNAVCRCRRLIPYGVFDRDFHFDSHEWSCS